MMTIDQANAWASASFNGGVVLGLAIALTVVMAIWLWLFRR